MVIGQGRGAAGREGGREAVGGERTMEREEREQGEAARRGIAGLTCKNSTSCQLVNPWRPNAMNREKKKKQEHKKALFRGSEQPSGTTR